MKSPPELVRKTPTRVMAKLEYEVITPMMGGGAKPREADEVTTVRASSVLGQLRFWWRACRANGFQDLQSLRAREDEIWGTMSRPSAVQLSVQCSKRGEPVLGFDFRGTETPAYVAFPLQGTGGNPHGKVVKGIQFGLTLTYPAKVAHEVEAALWAWTMFGGIGARSRRGFGCLRLVKSSLNKQWSAATKAALQSEIIECWNQYVTPGQTALKSVPRLPAQPQFGANLALGTTPGDSRSIWHKSINSYKDLRQKRRPGNEPNRPGRSYWPEPDTIRRMTDRSATNHKPTCPLEGFPRAFYGLPIVFHFKDDRFGDPQDTSLEAKGYSRRASPLILKPVALTSGQCLALGLVLSPFGLPPGGLVLRGGGQDRPVKDFGAWDKLATLLETPSFTSGGPFAPIMDRISKI